MMSCRITFRGECSRINLKMSNPKRSSLKGLPRPRQLQSQKGPLTLRLPQSLELLKSLTTPQNLKLPHSLEMPKGLKLPQNFEPSQSLQEVPLSGTH